MADSEEEVAADATRDLSGVRARIRQLIPSRNHDDGSLGPLLIRFAWHCCGTYDKETRTGGSNGGTMRFAAEQGDPENKGFAKALKLVEKLHAEFPFLTRADLHVLVGNVAIEDAGGPFVPFAMGREDWSLEEAKERNGTDTGCTFGTGSLNPHGSRLPAADLGVCPIASMKVRSQYL